MADSQVVITQGTGVSIDTRTVGGEHRQVIVLGDGVGTHVAPVDTVKGVKVYTDIDQVALATGTNTLGTVTVGALPSVTIGTALPASNAQIGTVVVGSLPQVQLAAGTNGAGSVVVASLPSVTIGTALPASNAQIGTVVVANPANGTVVVSNQVQLAAGTNGAGSIVVSSLPSVTVGTALPASNAVIGTTVLQAGGTVAITAPQIVLGAGTNVAGTVSINPLPTSTNTIGTVTVGALPSVTIGTALPAGNATIGTVVTVGGAAGVQYDERATEATITGNAAMWRDGNGTIQPVTPTTPLPTSLTAGGTVAVTLPSVTIGTALPASNAVIGTMVLQTGGSVAVTIPSITVGTALPASNAVIGTVTVGANVEQRMAAGTNTVGTVVLNAGGTVAVTVPSITIGTALPASNATIGSMTLNAGGTVAVTVPSITIGTALPAGNATIGTVIVNNLIQLANLANGSYSSSGLGTTAGTVTSSAGTLLGGNVTNPNATGTIVYLQFFETASSVVAGTTVPNWFVGIPATGANNIAAAVGEGKVFAAGLKVMVSTAPTTATQPATLCPVSLLYK